MGILKRSALCAVFGAAVGATVDLALGDAIGVWATIGSVYGVCGAVGYSLGVSR